MKPIWCAGQARRSSRGIAQSLRSGVSPKAPVVPEGPPRRPVDTTRVLIAVRGPAPTASGANSVASALGSLARRDPGKTVRTYHEGFQSTLKIGTFYLAGNRNFLFGSDTTRRRSVDPSGGSGAVRDHRAGGNRMLTHNGSVPRVFSVFGANERRVMPAPRAS